MCERFDALAQSSNDGGSRPVGKNELAHHKITPQFSGESSDAWCTIQKCIDDTHPYRLLSE
jgi:hypothetical protein